MSISGWDPFKDVTTLQDRINRLFEDAFPQNRVYEDELSAYGWRPSVDIIETETTLIIKADLPGIAKENISVELKDNILFIKGEEGSDSEIKEERYLRRERCSGPFYRSFTINHPLSPGTISASFKDGLLTVTVQKAEDDSSKKIAVTIE